MKMNFLGTIVVSLVVALQSHAIKKVAGTEKKYGIALTQTIEFDEFEQIKLKSVAHGLRNKKVALMNFKVYLGEVLMPADAAWTQKISEFQGANPAGFQMTFLRDVPAKNLMEGFQDGLKENGVKIDSEPVKKFLELVKTFGDIKEKESFIVVRKKAATGDQVLVLIPGRTKEIISGPANWSDDILKLWAGKPADSGLEQMQKEIFK